MSDLQHKLYNHEVTPPAPLWDKITDALDESLLTDKFPSRLYSSTETPPPSAWTAISSALDELNLRPQYPDTLYNLETAPPPNTWDKIKSTLDQETPAVPFSRRRVIPFIRYAAAAAILAIAAFGAVRIMSSNAKHNDGLVTGKQTATSVQTPNDSNKGTTPGNTNSSASVPPNNADEEARNDAALENSKQTYASLDSRDKQKMKKVSEEFFQTPADPVIVSANFNPVHTYEELECSDVNAPAFASNNAIDIAGRYTMLMTPDGHFIRVSKKLGSLVCCVSGEEQDDDCIDQMKKWRKKIANSPVTPSPGNFMDILDLLNTLKDSSL